MGQRLRDWYRYLERQMHVSFPEVQDAGLPGTSVREALSEVTIPPALRGRLSQAAVSASGVVEGLPAGPPGRSVRRTPAGAQMPAAVQRQAPSGPLARRGGRRPLTESREEIVRRVVDPELTLHEAAAVLNLSKATIRRYTDQGRLVCLRTSGGQRRFRLSALLVFLDGLAAE